MVFKHVFTGKQFRMWMPVMPMTLVAARNATPNKEAFAIFRVMPRMTKHEIKEYLTKIYKLPVTKVRTCNYLGKRKRLITERGIIYFKYKDFKKARVSFDRNVLTDVGIGLRVPELEEQEAARNPPDDETSDAQLA